MSANLTSGEQGQWRAWCRILRPLLLWIIGLGLTLGYLEYQRLSLRTRLRGEITLESQPARLEAVVGLDGKPYEFGQRVSFGPHQLTIRHPKADPFVTNLFVWLGDHDLGRLELRRAHGRIEIQVDPPARQIDVAGPNWRQQFTNGNGLTVTVPTDRYTVTARYQYFSFKQDVEVERDQIASCTIFPQVGALQVSSIHPETTYALALPDGTGMEEGKLPTTFQNLATGKYLLRSRYKGIPREWPVEVLSGQTNVLEIRYPFGTLAVTTTPPGAKVLDESGESRGQTPVSLSEVPVGRWQGQIELEGYVPVKIDTEIQTNAVTTIDQRLLKRAFVEAMDTAQQALKRPNPDYAAAIAALELALKEEPGEL